MKQKSLIFLILNIISLVSFANAQTKSDSITDIYRKKCIKILDSCEIVRWKDISTTKKLLKQVEEFSIQYFDKEDIINADLNYYNGFINLYEGNFDSATEKFYKSLEIWNLYPDSLFRNLPKTFGSLANIFFEKSDYEQALIYYTKALSFFENKIETNNHLIALTYSNIAVVYEKLDDFENSLFYNQKAMKLRIKLYGKNNSQTAISQHNIAYIYLKTGKTDTAIIELNHAIEIFENEQDFYNLSDAFNNLGLAYLNKNQNIEAIYYYKKSLKLRKELFGEKHPDISQSYNNIAETYFIENKLDTAILYLDKSLKSNFVYKYYNLFTKTIDYDNILSEIEFLQSYNILGDIYIQKYKKTQEYIFLDSALFAYNNCISIIEYIKFGYKSESSKYFLMQNTDYLYRKATKIAVELYEISNNDLYKIIALKNSEKNKNSILLQNIIDSQALNYSELPDSILKKEKKLKTDLAYYDFKLKELQIKYPDIIENNEINELQKKKALLVIEYQSLMKNIETEFSDYYNIKYSKNDFDITEFQNQIDRNDIFIDYFICKDDSLNISELAIFIIEKNNFEIVKVDVEKNFIDKILKFKNSVSSVHENINDFTNFMEISSELYSILIKPIENQIKNRNVVIVPENELSLIPFEALISNSKMPDFPNYHNFEYLIKCNSISYAFSLSTLFNKNFIKSSEDFEYNLKIIYPELSAMQLFDNKVNILNYDLSEYKNELDKININKCNFTTNRFLSENLESKIIQLVTHGIFDNENPLLSKLIFSESETDDGILYAYQLAGKEINTELIVLTSCNSGMGEIANGEGVMSFSRAFFISGVNSLVSTLWSIGDKSCSEIIFNFYKNLKNTDNKSVALQNAKLQYIENTLQTDKLQPYYWAGITLTGNNSAIFSSNKKIYLIVGICFFSIIIFSIILYRRR